MSNQDQLEIREIMPGFGAEVLNVDVRHANAETRNQLVQLFNQYGALLIRNQNLENPEDMMDFATIFGEPEGHTQEKFTLPGYPKIYLLSNRKENGRPVGFHFSGVGWHTDYSYIEEPVKQTMVYALEVPPKGGDTILADLCAAYDALSEERRKRLDGLVLHHSYKNLAETREYGRDTLTLTREIEENHPDVFHPLIRTHPENARKALWVSTGTVKEIVGIPNPEGLRLLDELVEFSTQEKFTYRHKWRIGDIVTWDNRCTLHTGTLFDDSKYIRHAYRLWIKGDKPV